MGWVDPTDRVNGDVLDANLWNQDVVENSLAIFRHLNPVGTVIPYAGDWGDPNAGYPNLADPDVGAPFHLPCTGGVYATADFPLLSRVLGHTFAPLGSGHKEGDIAGGEHLVGGGTDADGNPYIAEAVYRYQTSPLGWKLVVADGFVVPDMRGRSPMGATDGEWENPDGSPINDQPVARAILGGRWGDWRLATHSHYAPWDNAGNGTGGVGFTRLATPTGAVLHTSATGEGTGANYPPHTIVHFLIFTGQKVADAPDGHKPKSTGLRDGSVHRLHLMTTEHMIRQRLADPDLSDDEREMWEAQLNGEPWPPIPEEVS